MAVMMGRSRRRLADELTREERARILRLIPRQGLVPDSLVEEWEVAHGLREETTDDVLRRVRDRILRIYWANGSSPTLVSGEAARAYEELAAIVGSPEAQEPED